MKLLIALQNRRRNTDRNMLLMCRFIFLVLALSKAAHIGLNFLFLSGCLQQIVFKQVLSIQYAAEFLHERDLLFPQFQYLLRDVVLQIVQSLWLNLQRRSGWHRDLTQKHRHLRLNLQRLLIIFFCQFLPVPRSLNAPIDSISLVVVLIDAIDESERIKRRSPADVIDGVIAGRKGKPL